MAGVQPTAAFADVELELALVSVGERFRRIFLSRYNDPLGYGKTKSRFSDPRDQPDGERFGVLYLGATLKVCFVEAILRDQRNGVVGDYPIEECELKQRRYAEIEAVRPLSLVDLRGDRPVRMGIPSDVAGASEQASARAWSLAIHQHPAVPDGIIYPSRLNGETNVALYDRAFGGIAVTSDVCLLSGPGLATVLNTLKVALV